MLSHFRADCLPPSLYVASMGSALVVYTLEGVVPRVSQNMRLGPANSKMGVGKYKNITYHRIEKVLGGFFNHGRVKMAVGLRYGQTEFS